MKKQLKRPPIGTRCILKILPTTTQVLVEIKGYDRDFVWCLAARRKYISIHIDNAEFYEFKEKSSSRPTAPPQNQLEVIQVKLIQWCAERV